MTRKKFYTPDAGTEQMLSHIHYCKNFSKKIQCTKYVQNKPKKKTEYFDRSNDPKQGFEYW